MSTRSEIGILNNDGTVTSIYCHWDGYPEYNGEILCEYYTNNKVVNELISNGDLSSLSKNINPNTNLEHNFENSPKDVCVYYHRDRGEKWESVKPVTYKDINDWEKQIKQGWQEYMYLFKSGEWYFTNLYNEIVWKKLKTYLNKEIANDR